MDLGDAERTRLIGATRGLLSRGESDEGDKQRLSALAGDLFGLVALEDLERYPARALADFVRSADSLLAVRKPGETVVRITDPTPGEGETPDHAITLVEILNDDMPFLVNSTLLELQAAGVEIRLIAHPIVSVDRDRAGRLVAYHGREGGARGSIRESLIQIHLARIARRRTASIWTGGSARCLPRCAAR